MNAQNSQTDSDSGAGTDGVWNARDDDEEEEEDQNSNSSINDFLMSSSASSGANSPTSELHLSLSDLTDNNDGSLTDSMVGFSESDAGNNSPDAAPITISSDSSSGYHTLHRAPLYSPPPPHGSPGSQHPHSDDGRGSALSLYLSAESPPNPRSPNDDSGDQSPDRTPIYSGSSYSDGNEERDQDDDDDNDQTIASSQSSSSESNHSQEHRARKRRRSRDTPDSRSDENSSDSTDSSVNGSPRNKRSRTDEFYYEETYREEYDNRSASSQSEDSDDF